MLRKTLFATLLCSSPLLYASSDLDQLRDVSQEQFRGIAEDLGAAFSYKALAPAEALGVTGFDIGVEITATKLKSTQAWNEATGENIDYLPVPKVHVHKGLPFNIDVGAFLAMIPDTDMKLYGGELRYTFVSGNVAMPAFAIRGAHTRLAGVDELDYHSTSLEATISKGFLMFTPYAGVGKVWSVSTPHIDEPLIDLREESVTQTRLFAGVNMNFGITNFAIEADKTGDAASYGAKIGFRF